jgi:hypothetical protein
MGLVETKKTIMEKPLLWFGIGIVVLSIIALVVVVFLRMNVKEDDQVLANVGDEKIYQKDLNEEIYGMDFEGSPDNPPEVSNEDKKYLLDVLVKRKVAEKEMSLLDIKVTDDEVSSLIFERLGYNYEEYTSFQKELVKKAVKGEILLDKVLDKSIGLRAGKMFVCRFDYSYEFGKDINSAEYQKRTQDDKAYSEKLCTDLYNDVNSGKITFEQAMEKAKADKVIGQSIWGRTYSIDMVFSKEDFESRRWFRDSVNLYDALSTVKKDELLKPTLISLKNDEDQSKTREAFYVVAKITDAVESEYTSKDDWFNKMKEKYKVEYKVNY